MTQGQRIRKLRKSLNLTLEKFGKTLGVGKTAISNIENGNRNLTEQMILAISREFNVNQEWLRTGSGEMFIPLTRNKIIGDFVDDLIKEDDTFKKRLIEALAKLDKSEWEILEKLAIELADKTYIPSDPEELERQYPPVEMEKKNDSTKVG